MKVPAHIPAMLTVALATGAVVLPWVAGPLGWLPVLLHESAHGVAAVATGAEHVQITLTRDGGGGFRSMGGSPTLVWSAGYLGGPLCALGASRLAHRWPGAALATIAVLVATSTAFWLPHRDAIAMGLFAAAGVLGGLSLGLSDERARRLEPLVMLYLCAYGLADVVFDAWHAAPDIPSDAAQLAAGLGVPELAVFAGWGVAVLLISRAATSRPTEP